MPANLLVTGPPGSGKSTVLERTARLLSEQGWTVGGIVSPEMTTLGARVGFRIEDVATGESEIMAHVDRRQGPRVGKYRVDVQAVDHISEQALTTARDQADAVLIDEIAPMETYSEVFVEEVTACLDADVPVIGSIHRKGREGFIGQVKEREDVEILTVSRETRDDLPAELVDRVLSHGQG